MFERLQEIHFRFCADFAINHVWFLVGERLDVKREHLTGAEFFAPLRVAERVDTVLVNQRIRARTSTQINFVADQNDWNIVANASEITVPVGNVTEGELGREIEENHGGLTLDVITVTQATDEFFIFFIF